MMGYRIDAAVCSHIGNLREKNEDNYYFDGVILEVNQGKEGTLLHNLNAKRMQVYAVCDGMGGEEAGEEASMQAVLGIKEFVGRKKMKNEKQIRSSLQTISNEIERQANAKDIHSGTTIAMVVFCWNHLIIAHVGDSRVYSFKDHEINYITTDHSEVQQMIAFGLLKEEDAHHNPRRHVINQYLGMPQKDALLSPEVSVPLIIEPSTRLLICSDGLTDMVENERINEIVSNAVSADIAVKALTDEALQNGGRDNITTICLFIKKKESLWNLFRKKNQSNFK